MTTALLILGVITLLAGAGLCWAVMKAPVGHEDETGFHFGDGLTRKRKSRSRRTRTPFATTA